MECLEWYALHTRARHEKVVFTALEGKGYGTMLPTYRVWHRSGERLRASDLPLFGGYVFSRFDAGYRLPILTIPGVLGVVGFGKPLPITPSEVDAISRICASDLPRQPWPYLRAGDQCRIEFGPLQGIEGIYVCDKNVHRLILSMTLLQRSVAVEVDREWIRPCAVRVPGLPPAQCRVTPNSPVVNFRQTHADRQFSSF